MIGRRRVPIAIRRTASPRADLEHGHRRVSVGTDGGIKTTPKPPTEPMICIPAGGGTLHPLRSYKIGE